MSLRFCCSYMFLLKLWYRKEEINETREREREKRLVREEWPVPRFKINSTSLSVVPVTWPISDLVVYWVQNRSKYNTQNARVTFFMSLCYPAALENASLCGLYSIWRVYCIQGWKLWWALRINNHMTGTGLCNHLIRIKFIPKILQASFGIFQTNL